MTGVGADVFDLEPRNGSAELVAAPLTRRSVARCYDDCHMLKRDLKMITETPITENPLGLNVPDHATFAFRAP